MPYVTSNYLANAKAPLGKWACTRTSPLDPFSVLPPVADTHAPNFCGQCVSFVTAVCPTIPVNTLAWRKGARVRGTTGIKPGTAIATFDDDGKYSGHAAIYDSQTLTGINVVDQWVAPPAQAAHHRMLRFGAQGNANDGNNFFVID